MSDLKYVIVNGKKLAIYKFSLEGNRLFNGKIIPVSITNP